MLTITINLEKGGINMVERGDIYLCDLGQNVGSEQSGYRPVVVIQNNVGNKFSPTVVVSAITSNVKKLELPTHVKLFRKIVIY